MFSKIRRSMSPSMVVALIALFVALSGTAVAAGVVPKAKVALNALKLQGKTAAQVAALPSPAASAAGLTSVKTSAWSLGGSQQNDFTLACDAGQKAVGGGWDNPAGTALSADSRPSSDGGSWKVFIFNLSSSAAASGNVYAVCLK